MTRRIGDRILLGTWLLVLWCLLWGRLSAAVVASGVVVAALALAAARLPVLPVALRPRWHRLPGALVSLLVDVARSSVEVAAAALSRRTPRAAVIKVTLSQITDVQATIVANRISLVPGTLVIDLDLDLERDEDTLYVYVVPVRDADDARNKERHAVQMAEQTIQLFSAANPQPRNGG
ncbi:Na+/H+ antiporter subunit E [Phytoactinopolyspora halotolerans]|uniref:Na+/H+ antiporter subunit E n=1 Tax=Phytoactinopolyspora halotolerans TaxID=1981512 RepID=A0A6L9SBN7_9ACTN|nr:Na+/H+ antiporter subunit E [Phytoactinopolyspora halotolerans]NEE02012.1 Na+/H+ antiporter subunit E [Phytoactinopolyspora halotolerans]